GLEYFRSELYYLKFSWLSPGLAFGFAPDQVPLGAVGVYGISFLLTCVGCAASALWLRSKVQGAAVLLAGLSGLRIWAFASPSGDATPALARVRVTGVQMEFPTETEVLMQVDEALRKEPTTDLMVLSEYTFTEPVPEKVKNWCRDHRCYLTVGGKQPFSG